MMSRGEGGPVLVATATPLIPFPTVTPPVLRVANSKEKRSHSAHTLHSSRNASVCSGREPVDLPKRKRVQSAVEGRQVVKLSLADTPYGSKVWGETSYTANYQEKKPIPLPKVRPASATRMNNPHPSQVSSQSCITIIIVITVSCFSSGGYLLGFILMIDQYNQVMIY